MCVCAGATVPVLVASACQRVGCTCVCVCVRVHFGFGTDLSLTQTLLSPSLSLSDIRKHTHMDTPHTSWRRRDRLGHDRAGGPRHDPAHEKGWGSDQGRVRVKGVCMGVWVCMGVSGCGWYECMWVWVWVYECMWVYVRCVWGVMCM